MFQVCRLSQICRLRSARCASLFLLGAFLPAGALDRAAGAESGPKPAAILQTYSKPDGQTFFALKLSPHLPQPKTRPSDLVVLFDTSASQIGAYRAKALDTLRAMLSQLADGDRVALLAVDVNAARMSQGWLPPKGDDMRQALAALERRVPLGSTDMGEGLDAALAAWQEARDAQRNRSVVYIGDGFSTAGLVSIETFERLVREFVERRVSVSSYAIGPRLNGELLGALANHTGGMVVANDDQTSDRQLGSYLATIARAAVIWPTATNLPAAMNDVYPRITPPLRFDRDSVLFGMFALDAVATREPLPVELKGELAGKPMALSWQVAPEPPAAENAYLANVVEAAARTEGVGLPIVGSAGLNELRRWAGASAQGGPRAERLPARTDESARLAHEAERPNADRRAPGSAAHSPEHSAGGDLRLAHPENIPATHNDPLDGDLVSSVERQQAVVEGFLLSEVNEALNRANSSMTGDPSAAGYQLKVLLEKVQQTADIRPELRTQMVDRIEGVLRMASRKSTERTQQELQQQQAAAAAEARERMVRGLDMQQEKVDQLMSRFDALMAEERYRDAETMADLAQEVAPATPGLRGAELTARMTGYTAGNNAMRDMTYKGMVDSLFQVELSNVPTPDDPPIVYPDPGVWQLLTERRKKYRAIDLSKHGPNEEKILAAMDERTDIDFAEQPLADVVDYLKQRHGIEIQLDKKALTDAGIGSDVPITRSLKGITLRSALKLLLGELDLTYVLRNEVLMITSKTEAENMLSQRVYPVADLVMPISPARNLAGPAGGGMGGGLLGGMGMGMGGMGSGMGGMGMGMGGMGMGMGGMGMGGMGGMGMGGMGGGMGFF